MNPDTPGNKGPTNVVVEPGGGVAARAAYGVLGVRGWG
jgi:hypothetical protein